MSKSTSNLEEFLSNPNEFTSVNLYNVGINNQQAIKISEALAQNQSLTTLNLIGNQIGDAGAKAIGQALAQNQSLTTLNLSGNQIGIQGRVAIFQALAQNQSLTALNLSGNKIKKLSIFNKLIIDAVIDPEGRAKAIGQALAQNKSLTTLNLSGNNIGDEEGVAIGQALAQNQSLTRLYLDENNIGAEGGVAIGQALAQNKSLTTLYLDENNVGDEGAKAIGQALAQNHSLKTLHLEYNKIGDEGAKAIGQALAQNHSLILLDLKYNNIGDNILSSLNCSLKVNQDICEVDKNKLNNPSQALNDYKAILQRAPEKLIVYSRIIKCYMMLNRPQEAINYYNQLLQLDPSKELIISKELVNCYQKVGQYENALHYVNKILELNPIDQEAQDNKLELLMYLSDKSKSNGSYDDAVQQLKQALEVPRVSNNQKLDIKIKISELLKAQGKYEEALSYLEPNNSEEYIDLLIRVSNDYAQNQEHRKALQYYEQALLLSPNLNKVDFLENTAICYHALQRYNESLIYCNKAISMRSKNEKVKNIKFEILTNIATNAGTKEAIGFLVEALTIRPREQEIIIKIAKLFVEQSEFEQALVYFNQALRIDNTNETIKHEIGKIYLQRGQYQEARDYLLKTSTEYSTACQKIGVNIIQMANEDYQQGKYYEAFDKYEQSLDYAQDRGEIYKNMANCCNNLELYEDAINYAKQASQYLKWKMAAKEIIIKALLNLAHNNMPETAEKYLREALEYKPNDQELRNELGKKLAAQNNHEQALKYLTDNVSLLRSREKIAKRYAKQQDPASQAEALKHYVKALLIADFDKVKYKSLSNKVGELHFNIGNYKEALEYLSEDNDLRKKVQNIINEQDRELQLGLLRDQVNKCIEQGKKEEAIKLLKEILIKEQQADDIIRLCNLYIETRQYDDCLSYLKVYGNGIAKEQVKILSLFAYNGKAVECYETKDISNTIENLLAALDVSPTNVEIMDNLGWAFLASEEVRNYEEALKYFTIISSKAGAAITNNRLGEFYLQEGDNKKAIKYFEDALKLEEDDLYLGNLGYTYLQGGKFEEAISYFEKINNIGTKQYERAIEYKKIALNKLLSIAKKGCKNSGNSYEKIEEVLSYYNKIKELVDESEAKAYYFCKEAKFRFKKLYGIEGNIDKVESLVNQALSLDPGCQDAQYIKSILEEEAELAGNSDDYLEL